MRRKESFHSLDYHFFPDGANGVHKIDKSLLEGVPNNSFVKRSIDVLVTLRALDVRIASSEGLDVVGEAILAK